MEEIETNVKKTFRATLTKEEHRECETICGGQKEMKVAVTKWVADAIRGKIAIDTMTPFTDGEELRMALYEIRTESYEAILSGKQTSVVLKNDLDYKVDDRITLMDWDFDDNCQRTHGSCNKKNEITVRVDHVQKDDAGITDGYCVLSISKLIFGGY